MREVCLLVLMALPVLIQASINVEVIASEKESERQVHISGSEINIISDEEIETFKLYDTNLKQAINKYYGATPDDVFLKSPTPWNDLYTRFGWKPVNRILKPIRAKIFAIEYKPILIMTQIFNNTSSKVGTFQGYIRHTVEDTITSIWETSGQLLTGLNISYGFDIVTVGVSGKSAMSYTSKWGQRVMKSQMVTVGSETGLEITLQPNQSVKAELMATRGGFNVQIDYEATLFGTVAVNYNNGYKDHHFYGLDINSVLNAGNISRSVYSSENITLNYYTDSEVIVRDYDNNDIFYNPNLI